MRKVELLTVTIALFFLVVQVNGQTYTNAQLNTWYYGNVNSSSGTISYQLALPSQYKTNQTLFRIYTQVNDPQNKNMLCTEVLTPVPNYEPSFCYEQPDSPKPICVTNLGSPYWADRSYLIVLVDCNAGEDTDCDEDVPYKIYFSFVQSTVCDTTGIPGIETGGGGHWLIIILVVAAFAILSIVIIALAIYCYFMKKKQASYEILADN